MGTTNFDTVQSDDSAFLDASGNTVIGAQGTAIVSITDSTTGTATDTINDSTADTKDDLASLAAKIEEILGALRTHGLIAT